MATVPIEPFAAQAIGPAWAADPRDLRWLDWAPASYPFNMTGQPALSLPAGLTRSGLPVGLQLVGPVGADDLILTVARRLEADRAPLPHPPVPTPVSL
ncbi:amidase family protein [Streptomyces sp. M10(2022)]